MDAARWERLQALFHRGRRPAAGRRERAAARRGLRRRRARCAPSSCALLDEDARRVALLDRDVARRRRRPCSTTAGRSPRLAAASAPTASSERSAKAAWASSTWPSAPTSGSSAAIKILRDAWLSPARRERFAAEQRTLAQLDSSARSRASTTPTRCRRHAVVRHGVRRGRAAHGVLPPHAPHARRAAAAVPRRLRGGAARAPAPDHPPRSQAVEHPGHAATAR